MKTKYSESEEGPLKPEREESFEEEIKKKELLLDSDVFFS